MRDRNREYRIMVTHLLNLLEDLDEWSLVPGVGYYNDCIKHDNGTKIYIHISECTCRIDKVTGNRFSRDFVLSVNLNDQKLLDAVDKCYGYLMESKVACCSRQNFEDWIDLDPSAAIHQQMID